MGGPRSSKSKRAKAQAEKVRGMGWPIYSEHVLSELTLAQEQSRGNALHALSLMRSKGYSLARAAREVELRPEAVRGWVGQSIAKKGRRYAARPSDRLVRVMKIMTE